MEQSTGARRGGSGANLCWSRQELNKKESRTLAALLPKLLSEAVRVKGTD